ncbi:hypothetical protein [Scytonema sp. NUACC21]
MNQDNGRSQSDRADNMQVVGATDPLFSRAKGEEWVFLAFTLFSWLFLLLEIGNHREMVLISLQ